MRYQLKITGRNTERVEQNLKDVLSLATLVCHKGYVPTPRDIETAETLGMWYSKDTPNRYNLIPTCNDYWANIIEQGENFIVLEFNIRYDGNEKKTKSLSELILAWFDDFVECV